MPVRGLVRSAYAKASGEPLTGDATREEVQRDWVSFTAPMEQIHAGLHGSGVAQGLAVRAVAGSADLQLTTGVAIDIEGRHICLAPEATALVEGQTVTVTAAGVTVPTAGFDGTQQRVLTLTHRERVASGQVAHSPRVALETAANASGLVLATVDLNNGTVSALSPAGRVGLRPVTERLTVHRIAATEQGGALSLDATPVGELRPTSTGGLELAADPVVTTGRLGVGSASPRNPVGIRGTGSAEELLSFESSAGQTTWHINQSFGGRSGLNIVETGVADGRLYIGAGGNVGVNTTTPTNPLHVSGNSGIRQNALHLSGGTGGSGGSSFSYNAHRNAANDSWVFPDPSRPAVTVEMDDHGGKGRFQVWSTTTGNKQAFVQRLAVDGETGQVTVGGQLVAGGGARASGVTVGTHGEDVQYSNPYETVGVSRSNYNLRLQSPNWILLHTAGSERLRVDPTGQVTIPAVLTVGSLAVAGGARCWNLNIGGGGDPGSDSARIGRNLVVNCATWPEADKILPSWSGGGVLSWDIFARGGLYVGKPADPPIQMYGNGTLRAKDKKFSIPHPLDARRRLEHGCVEGPEQAVTYRGRATLRDGCAEVRLPAYFEALTRAEDRTVQVTPVLSEEGTCSSLGASAVRDGRFIVRALDGGSFGGEFCWQVTAVRADIEPLVVEPEPGRRVDGPVADRKPSGAAP